MDLTGASALVTGGASGLGLATATALQQRGAHVVIEAIRSGTPVLASRIDGNVGLLGNDYPGYFAPGDDAGLAALLERARDDADMLPRLTAQLTLRAPLFAPEAERDTLHRIVGGLLSRRTTGSPP